VTLATVDGVILSHGYGGGGGGGESDRSRSPVDCFHSIPECDDTDSGSSLCFICVIICSNNCRRAPYNSMHNVWSIGSA